MEALIEADVLMENLSKRGNEIPANLKKLEV